MPPRGPSSTLDAAELAQRRRGARRLAWILGLAVLLMYASGFFISR